jgi:peptidoglycan/xylan/chitin deacetylase (PgdA/CDA1 family)
MRAGENMRKFLRQTSLRLGNTSVFGAAIRMLDRVAVPGQSVLAVVTYHRIDDANGTPDLYPGLISATPDRFNEQLDMLSEIGHVVSMRQVLDACRGQLELPTRSILITFDDACQDFAELAWPALRARQMPAAVFVPTAYPGQPDRRFWWDRLHVAVWRGKSARIDTPCGKFKLDSDTKRNRAMRTLRDYVKQLEHERAMQVVDEIAQQQEVALPPRSVLGWEQLRTLSREGVTMVPHTQTHPLLTRVSIEHARKEVVGSRDDLIREIGEVLPVFAYPGGEHDQSVIDMLRQEGFELAFSVRRGVNDLKVANPLSLNRFNIGQPTTPQVLRAQLVAGWWKHRAR